MISYNEKFTIVTKNIRIAEDLQLAKASISQVSKKIAQFIKDLHSELVFGMEASDQIFCAIFHPELDIPIGIRFMPREDFTEALLESEIIKVFQSKKALRLDQTLEVKCKIARTMSGSGLVQGGDEDDDDDDDDDANDNNTNDLLSAKRCVVRMPQPKDNLCALRAIICAKHYLMKDISRMDNYRRGAAPRLEQEVKELANILGFGSQPMGHTELAKVESYLKDFQITVYDQYSKAATSNQPLYRGPRSANAFIYLLFYKKHYWPITSAKAFFQTKLFCHYCKTATNHIELHRCESICAFCKRADCKHEPHAYVRCSNCQLNCSNETCLHKHIKYCPNRKTCNHCGVKFVYKHNCQVVETKYC